MGHVHGPCPVAAQRCAEPEEKPVRIVVTGASGNLGTALLRRLAADDEAHDVVGIVRRPPQAGADYAGVEWHALDLADDDAAARLRGIVEGADAVVHLAWLFQPSRDIDYLRKATVGGSRAVLDAATEAGVGHLVHLSSLGAYSPGPKDRAVDESWPTGGSPTLPYSRHKVEVERMLDHSEGRPGSPRIARIRPGLVVQRDAGSALARYGVPVFVPSQVLRHLLVFPVDRSLRIQLVHADDVADALVRVLRRRAEGAFNLAAEPPVTRDDLAAAFGAWTVHLPAPVLRTAAALAWRARIQPVDPGWLDLAFAVPLMDSARARRELGWEPSVDARAALAEVVAGMAEAAGTASPVLRPRSVVEQLAQLARRGPIGDRRLP